MERWTSQVVIAAISSSGAAPQPSERVTALTTVMSGADIMQKIDVKEYSVLQ